MFIQPLTIDIPMDYKQKPCQRVGNKCKARLSIAKYMQDRLNAGYRFWTYSFTAQQAFIQCGKCRGTLTDDQIRLLLLQAVSRLERTADRLEAVIMGRPAESCGQNRETVLTNKRIFGKAG